MLHGVLIVDKPQGWTSHDVVARVRHVAGQREVGHAGTLDPLATGVLVVLLGRATKLAPYVSGTNKTYCAEVVLGATTASDDAEMPALTVCGPGGVTRQQIEDVLPTFLGNIRQLPPSYAAIKVEGKKLYEQARKGATTVREPRDVTIHSINVLDFDPPRLRLRVDCSSGTYIRSLARDIGEAVGVGGYLHGLRRIASGIFCIEDAVDVARLDPDNARRELLPLDMAVLGFDALALDREEERMIRNGRSIPLQVEEAENVRAYAPSGALAALGRVENSQLKPFRVFASDEESDAHRS